MMGWSGPITHRQFLAWQEWLFMQWNRPNKTDHYIMRVSQRIRQALAKNPNKITLSQELIEFKKPKPKKKLTPEEEGDMAMHAWIARLGGWGRASRIPKLRLRDKDGNIVPLTGKPPFPQSRNKNRSNNTNDDEDKITGWNM